MAEAWHGASAAMVPRCPLVWAPRSGENWIVAQEEPHLHWSSLDSWTRRYSGFRSKGRIESRAFPSIWDRIGYESGRTHVDRQRVLFKADFVMILQAIAALYRIYEPIWPDDQLEYTQSHLANMHRCSHRPCDLASPKLHRHEKLESSSYLTS